VCRRPLIIVLCAVGLAACGGQSTHPRGGRARTRPLTATAGYYVAQSPSGIGNGSSCANAENVSTLTRSAEWTPGKVIVLCGTITTPITAEGSGTKEKPITVYWERGASLSEPYCHGINASCFDTNANTYLTLDGGSNGSIRATENGSELTYQKSSNGIDAEGCTGCTFERLAIENMYVHTMDATGLADGATACTLYCAAIIWNGSSVAIVHDTLHDDGWALVDSERSTDTNTEIDANTIYNVSHGIALGADAAGGSIGPVLIYNNSIFGYANWTTTDDSWHNDGIHCYVSTDTSGAPPHYNGLYIYDNVIGPGGRSGAGFNADIYLEGGSGGDATPCADSTSSVYVFNNVMSATNDGGCGVSCGYSGNLSYYNNTIIGADPRDVCNVFQDGSGYTIPTSMAFENNLTTTCGDEIVARAGSFAGGQPTHNVYARGGSNSFVCGANFYPFTQVAMWRACIGGDAQSTTTANARLDSDGSLRVGSPGLGAGANLSSLCSGYLVPLCREINGAPRPTAGVWDAGAY
jgi:hypothetical protein